MTASQQFPQRDLTHRIIGAAFAVHNTLGFGYLEAVYRRALAVELRKQGIDHQLERTFDLLYEGVDVGSYRADLIVDSAVIVEVKSGLLLDPAAAVQLLNYLRASGIEVGIIIHFGLRVEVKRLVMSDALKGIRESPISLP